MSPHVKLDIFHFRPGIKGAIPITHSIESNDRPDMGPTLQICICMSIRLRNAIPYSLCGFQRVDALSEKLPQQLGRTRTYQFCMASLDKQTCDVFFQASKS